MTSHLILHFWAYVLFHFLLYFISFLEGIHLGSASEPFYFIINKLSKHCSFSQATCIYNFFLNFVLSLCHFQGPPGKFLGVEEGSADFQVRWCLHDSLTANHDVPQLFQQPKFQSIFSFLISIDIKKHSN